MARTLVAKAKAKPQAKAKAQAKAALVASEQTLDEKFGMMMTALKNKGAMVQDWVLLREFLRILDLPSHHTTRDYLTGNSSWRVGNCRGNLLKLGTDWCYKPGKRGVGQGYGHPHVKTRIIKDVLSKYYRNRLLKV